MADIGKPETELGRVADEAMKLIEDRLGSKGEVTVMLTDWDEHTPNSNVSMAAQGGSDAEVAVKLIERLLAAAEETAKQIGYPLEIIRPEEN